MFLAFKKLTKWTRVYLLIESMTKNGDFGQIVKIEQLQMSVESQESKMHSGFFRLKKNYHR
jgi:hypothetical protein